MSFKVASHLGREFCIQVQGKLRARPAGTANTNLTSGQVELLAAKLVILNPSATPPFSLDEEVGEELRRLGVRVQVDDRNEKLGYRIREAQVQKVPYMLVVGDKEVEAKSVSVRHRQAGDLGPQDVASFGARVVRLSAERATRQARLTGAGAASCKAGRPPTPRRAAPRPRPTHSGDPRDRSPRDSSHTGRSRSSHPRRRCGSRAGPGLASR